MSSNEYQVGVPALDPSDWSAEQPTVVGPAPWALLASTEGNDDVTAVGPEPSAQLLALSRRQDAPAPTVVEPSFGRAIAFLPTAAVSLVTTRRRRRRRGGWVTAFGGLFMFAGLVILARADRPVFAPPAASLSAQEIPQPLVVPTTVAPVTPAPIGCESPEPSIETPPAPAVQVQPAGNDRAKDAVRRPPVQRKASKRHNRDHGRRFV